MRRGVAAYGRRTRVRAAASRFRPRSRSRQTTHRDDPVRRAAIDHDVRLLHLRAVAVSQAEVIRASVAGERFSYAPGILGGEAPPGMSDERLDVVLGRGEDVWCRARRALDHWAQFDLGWAAAATGGSPPTEGLDVLVRANRFGIEIHVASRIIETHDISDSDFDRYGFTYGTLASHVECGEELFEVWRDRTTGAVGYTIHAMAAPGRWYSRLAQPLVDHFRAMFRRDSAAVMAAIVGDLLT